MRKTYVLNPLAPEFIPRQFNNESYLKDQIIRAHRNNPMFHHPHYNQNFMPNRQSLRSPMQMNPQQIANHRSILNPYHQQMMNMHSHQQFPPFPTNFNGPLNFQNRTPPMWMNQNLPPPQPPPSQAPPHPNNLNSFHPFVSGAFKNGINNSSWPFLPPPQAPSLQQQQQQTHPMNLRQHFRPPQPPPQAQQNPIYQNPNQTAQQMLYNTFNQQQQQTQMQQNQYQQQQQQQQSPFTLAAAQLLQQQQQQRPPFSTQIKENYNFGGGMHHGNGSENGTKFEKDFHFLQNVHFPEPNHDLNDISHISVNDRRLEMSNEHLLPPNMSFQELVNQPKDFQYYWFGKISERFGLEEADKFVELLKHFSQSNRNSNMMLNKDQSSNSAKNLSMASIMQPTTSNQHQPAKSVDKIEESLLASLTKEFGNETPKETVFYSNFSENNILGIDLLKNDKPSIPLYLRTRNTQ
jgi:hypothetical protein